jgi:hypothetical protein
MSNSEVDTYQWAIKNMIELADHRLKYSDRDIEELDRAGLPLAAVAVAHLQLAFNPVPNLTVGALRALCQSAMSMSDFVTAGVAITYWIAPAVMDRILDELAIGDTADGVAALRAGLAYGLLWSKGVPGSSSSRMRAGVDPAILAEVDAARAAEFERLPTQRSVPIYEPQIRTPFGWVVRVLLEMNHVMADRITDASICALVELDTINPEIVLGAYLRMRMYHAMAGGVLPPSTIAPVLAEALARWRRPPVLVLPAVII